MLDPPLKDAIALLGNVSADIAVRECDYRDDSYAHAKPIDSGRLFHAARSPDHEGNYAECFDHKVSENVVSAIDLQRICAWREDSNGFSGGAFAVEAIERIIRMGAKK